MNLDEVMVIEASPQLDELIAVHVFGESKPPQESQEYQNILGDVSGNLSDGKCWYRRYVYAEGDTGEWHPVAFSSSMTKAWRIIDENRAGFKDNGFLLEWCPYKKMWLITVALVESKCRNTLHANTPELAICRAALWATSG